MTRIACLTVQRDETLLLRPWLLYHGYLIGFENLFVFDENSTNPAVRATLEEFRALGVNIEAETLLLEGIAKFGETLVLLRERALLAQYSADYAQASALWRTFVERFADRPDGYQYGARAHRAASTIPATFWSSKWAPSMSCVTWCTQPPCTHATT